MKDLRDLHDSQYTMRVHPARENIDTTASMTTDEDHCGSDRISVSVTRYTLVKKGDGRCEHPASQARSCLRRIDLCITQP
jgi:hypothetical protein